MLAGGRADNSRDEAAAVRMFNPAIQDILELAGTIERTLAMVRRDPARLAKCARLIEEQSNCRRRGSMLFFQCGNDPVFLP